MLISLFLPWFTASDAFISVSVNGLWHGWEYITLIVGLAMIAYLVLRAGFRDLQVKLPFGHDQLLLAGASVNVVLVLLGFLIRPASGFGWTFGAFIGLIAAIVAVFPLARPFIQARNSR
jgi:D-alanyl-lipoteichoic acid acyltransferase DltB (MBOAT superfamily)